MACRNNSKKCKQPTMGRSCSVENCPNKQETGQSSLSFYKFPADLHLCDQWVDFCSSAELTAAYKASGPYGIGGRKICSDHFTRDSFRVPENKYRGLLFGAVPRLKANLEDPQPEPHTEMKKVEKRYYVQGKNDLFEVLILGSS